MLKEAANLNIVLLHDQMVDKTNKLVTTSLTLIDVHDISRSARTYGVNKFYVAHSSPAIRKLARVMKDHWQTGFGANYNPNRKEALEEVHLVTSLDEAIAELELATGKFPKLIATSARPGGERINFKQLQDSLAQDQPYLLMLGTGWGMSPELLNRADYFLEPVASWTDYNHLSVRSACAIMLDRLLGKH